MDGEIMITIKELDDKCKKDNLRLILTKVKYIGGHITFHTGFRKD